MKKVKEKALLKSLDKMHKYKTMISFCLKCEKNTESKNPKVSTTSNNKTMLSSKCAICGIKNQDLSRNKKPMYYWVV